jgi:hypothetical protein
MASVTTGWSGGRGRRLVRVAALAGRRIDATDATMPRFPLANADVVRGRLEALLRARGTEILACSAACGADLIALDVAGALGLRRRVVLPFAPERFRESSVTDRPGDWGPLFDRIIGEVQARGDVVMLGLDVGDDATYAAANDAILNEAERLAGDDPGDVVAVIVWEGASRGEGDLTEAFATSAGGRGHVVDEVLTT